MTATLTIVEQGDLLSAFPDTHRTCLACGWEG